MKRLLPLLIVLSGCVPEWSLHLDAVWWDVPTAEICDVASDDRSKIEESLDWWYDISDEYLVNLLEDDVDCSFPLQPRTIRFTRADPAVLESREAAAYTSSTKLGRQFITDDLNAPGKLVSSATVYLAEDNRQRTVDHEIGHAFGWKHTEEDGHRMSSFAGRSSRELDHYLDLVWYDGP